MSSTTDVSVSQRSGHQRLRIAIIACIIALCLVVCYVLLSAPLMLYAVHHPGSSSAELVESYMEPLLWVDEFLTPDPTENAVPFQDPLHREVLRSYYRAWGSEVEEEYEQFLINRWLNSTLESMQEAAPQLGTEGPL